MAMSTKIISTIIILALGSAKAISPTYVAKLTVPHTNKTVTVPIFSPFLQEAEHISAEQAKYLLKWGLRDMLTSSDPLRHQQLGWHIVQLKNSLREHVAVFDADLLTEGLDTTTKTPLSYEQLATVHADIVRSLQDSAAFQQAFARNADDMTISTENLQNLIVNYRAELNAASSTDSVALAARLVEARIKAVVGLERETVQMQLQQKFALLDIAQQDAKLGAHLALRFAMLHHLYQQQIELRLSLTTAYDATSLLARELRFHQAREEFSRTLYLLLAQDNPAP